MPNNNNIEIFPCNRTKVRIYTKMTKKEIAEAINNLKFERVRECSVRGEIITGWVMKTAISACELNLGR